MSFSEENILLSHLTQLQMGLDILELKPYFKLSCCFTDEECEQVCDPEAVKDNNAAAMLVEVLRRKSSHCCCQMLLSALQHSVNKSGTSTNSHGEIISMLQTELKSAGGSLPSQSRAYSIEMDLLSASSTQDNNPLNYFPSATLEQPSLYHRLQPVLNGSLTEKPQRPTQNCHDDKKMELVISIGPSRDPAPMVRCSLNGDKNVASEISQSLIIESKKIQCHFSNFVLEVCTLLQESTTAYIEKLQMWLSFQSCTRAVQSLKVFDSTSDALKARTIPSLISALKGYSSWYNYDLISDIARKFCGEKGSKLVDDYELFLRDYLQRLIIHCPPVFPDHEETTKDSELLEVKVDLEISSSALKDIAIFKHTLCQVCDLDPRFLIMRRINTTNNYQLCLSVPKAAMPFAMQGIKSQWNILLARNIKAVKISGQDLQNEAESNPRPSTEVKRSTSQSLHCTIDDDIIKDTTSKMGLCIGSLPNANTNSVIDDVSNGDSQSVDADTANLYSSQLVQLRRPNQKMKRMEKTRSIGIRLHSESSTTSMLSEISESLNCPDLLSYADGSAISVSSPKISAAPISPKKIVTRTQSVLVNSPRTVTSESEGLDLSSTYNLLTPSSANSTKKSTSFLWRILGRSSPENCANVYVVAIRHIQREVESDLDVRKGLQLRAIYRVKDRIFVENPSLNCGFVPYSSCRISRKYYGINSGVLQLSYLQLYLQSPDGIDSQSYELVPNIMMMAVEDHTSSSKEELSIENGEIFTSLYCDSMFVYGVSGDHSGLLPRSTCELSKKSQLVFKSWQKHDQLFQSDFVIRLSEQRPFILDECPVSVTSMVHKNSNKLGKIFTVNQNFVPNSPNSSNFTIRKGLRVKIIEENDKFACVSTKTGASFWIPFSHLRPARKYSDAEYIFQNPVSS